jgi:diguanylate cyclase (GGDEF)-like protein
VTAQTDTGVRAGPLEGLLPVAAVRLAPAPTGFELLDANRRALRLLGTSIDELLGGGFAAGFFGDDADLLAAAVADPDADRPTLVVRWGATPPVQFLGVDLERAPDGTVLAAMHDQSNEHRLDAMLCGQGTWAQMFDDEGFVTWLSAQSARNLGLTPDQYMGQHVTEIMHPDDHHLLLEIDREARARPGTDVVTWHRSRHPEIPDSWWPVRNVTIHQPDDPAIGHFIALTRLGVRSNEGADASDGSVDMTIAEMMPSGLILTGGDRIQFSNRLAVRMLGKAVEDPDPHRWVDAFREADRAPLVAALTVAETSGRRSTVTAALDGTGDGTVWLRVETMPSFDAVGHHVGYAATLLDVTAEITAREQMEQTQELLWRMANHDGLTGLPNRMQFDDRLERALARARRGGPTTALLFCDLDHFKQVNDEHGHAAGDTLLVEIAGRFRAVVRAADTVCRLGGDEFVVICEAVDDLTGVETLTRRLIDAVNRPVSLGGGRTATVGLCVGIAVASTDSTPEGLLALADAAVYEAKQLGRNGFVTARQGQDQPRRR